MESTVRANVVNFNPNSELMKLYSRNTNIELSSMLSTDNTSNLYSYWNHKRASSIIQEPISHKNNQLSTWNDNQVSHKTAARTENKTNQFNKWDNSEISSILTSRDTAWIANEADTSSIA